MEVRKSHIINLLFLCSFPFFGLGKYAAQVLNFSFGQVFSVLPLILIILFYIADLLLSKQFRPKLKPTYLLALIFNVCCIISLYAGLRNGYPALNNISTLTLSLVITIIIHAPFILQFYNNDNPQFTLTDLLYWGLTIDIFLNIIGYAAGLRNPIHSIEGRLNFPFGQGFYSIANTLAIINLIIIGKWMRGIRGLGMKIFSILHFLLNLVLIMGVNSRLSILIFVLIIMLWMVRALYQHRLLFAISLFTIPLLLSFSELIYRILSTPLFSALLQRVSYKDIVAFNGRRNLWERGIEWFSTAGDGFLVGNGYHGYYYIGLINDLEEFWSKSAINLHMHSSALEFALSIGIVGLLPLMALLFLGLAHIRRMALNNHKDGALLGVIFYLTFIFQIDNFVYITNYGAFIFFTIIATALVQKSTVINHNLVHAPI